MYWGGDWNTLGILTVISGTILIPFCKHGYKLDGNEGLFSLEEIETPVECKNDLLDYLDGKSDFLNLSPRRQCGSIIEIYRKKGSSDLYARYFDYSSYLNGIEYPIRKINTKQLESLRLLQPK